jgi:hypothetical protein
MEEPLYNGKTSREIIKDLAYKHLLYDEPESLLLEDWCKTPKQYNFGLKREIVSLAPLLPHRIVAKLIEINDEDLSELGLLISWCLTCESGVSPMDIEACVHMIANTPALLKYHSLIYRFYEEFRILLALKKNDRSPLEWKDIPEPQLTEISSTSCLSHSLQECLDRYFGLIVFKR